MVREIDTLGFHLYDKWLTNIRNGRSVDRFFDDNLYSDIAIYGFGMIGKQLFRELNDSGKRVNCIIDKKADSIKDYPIDVIKPSDLSSVGKIDAIVITPFDLYYEIEKELCEYVNCKETDIISVETVVEYIKAYG